MTPERELAVMLRVSRPVVHEGLVDLAAKGLVTLIPRVGTLVNDYRKDGSLAFLASFLNTPEGKLEPGLLDNILSLSPAGGGAGGGFLIWLSYQQVACWYAAIHLRHCVTPPPART